MVIVCMLLIAYWLFCNLYVARTLSIEEMYNEFVTEQTFVGKIFANSFYWLAWSLKKIAKKVLTY